jgi:hypothetical protein
MFTLTHDSTGKLTSKHEAKHSRSSRVATSPDLLGSSKRWLLLATAPSSKTFLVIALAKTWA